MLSAALQHACPGVRAAGLELVAAAAKALGPADCYVYLLPRVLPVLKSAPADLSSLDTLLLLLKPGGSACMPQTLIKSHALLRIL